MRIVTTALVVAALAGLAACAPIDPDSLRTDPGASATFDVPLAYETVFDNERAAFLACLTGWAQGSGRFAVKARIDRGAKTASIALVHHAYWTDIWAVVDIAANGSGSTVHAYTTASPLMADVPTAAKAWASGVRRCQKYAITQQQTPLAE